ncbi:glycosyltransferase family 4 protein [bacterium]|nr:glycosyltransferase family 4 protein [bacterium]
MKIVQVAQSLGLGGLEVLIHRLAVALRDNGHEVTIVALSEGGPVANQLQGDGFPVVICRPPVNGMRDLTNLRDTLQSLNPDVLHLHGLPCGTLGRLATIGSGIRTVYHLHTAVSEAHRPTAGMRFRERMLSFLPGRIVTVSESVRQDYTSTFLIPSSRVDVLPGGVPDCQPLERDTTRALFDLPEDAFIVTQVASLTPVKRHRDVLNALASLPGVHLALAGVGRLESDLREQGRQLGIADRAHFLGQVDDVHALYSASDLAILASSPREGLGLSLIEAQRAGIPAIGTRTGGIPEVIVDGSSGLLVSPESPDSIVNAIRELMKDKTRRHEMGKAARQRFESQFSMERYLQRLLILYKG